MSVLNRQQIEELVQHERESTKEGMLIGLLMASVSGAIVGMGILVVIQWWAK